MKYDVDKIRKVMESKRDFAQKMVDNFAEKFSENPGYALDWSSDVFDDVAELEVALTVLAMLDGDVVISVEVLKNFVTDKVLYLARQNPSSTSQQSNLMENARRKAWAELLTGFSSIF